MLHKLPADGSDAAVKDRIQVFDCVICWLDTCFILKQYNLHLTNILKFHHIRYFNSLVMLKEKQSASVFV